MKNKKSIIFLIIILIILAIMAGGLFIYKKLNKGQVEETIMLKILKMKNL